MNELLTHPLGSRLEKHVTAEVLCLTQYSALERDVFFSLVLPPHHYEHWLFTLEVKMLKAESSGERTTLRSASPHRNAYRTEFQALKSTFDKPMSDGEQKT